MYELPPSPAASSSGMSAAAQHGGAYPPHPLHRGSGVGLGSGAGALSLMGSGVATPTALGPSIAASLPPIISERAAGGGGDNIRVCARFRPLNKTEETLNAHLQSAGLRESAYNCIRLPPEMPDRVEIRVPDALLGAVERHEHSGKGEEGFINDLMQTFGGGPTAGGLAGNGGVNQTAPLAARSESFAGRSPSISSLSTAYNGRDGGGQQNYFGTSPSAAQHNLSTVSNLSLPSAGGGGIGGASAFSATTAHTFTYDHVFDTFVSQDEVYEEVGAPIVDDVMRGYNGTVFVYGQTGSGKTFTMMGAPLPNAPVTESGQLRGRQGSVVGATAGTPRRGGSAIGSWSAPFSPGGYQNPRTQAHSSSQALQAPPAFDLESPDGSGIIPRAVNHLFESMYASPDTVSFTVSLFFVEIYMEKVRDLLVPDPSQSNLSIREDPKSSSFFIEGCVMADVTSPQEIFDLLNYGIQNRATASTRMNVMSSRSHCMLCVAVHAFDSELSEQRIGKLFLVDLAGSEKVAKTRAEGQQLEEAKVINKSLTTLGHVISQLSSRAPHVPYRDSKLTKILQDALGGNSKTALIVCCSPSIRNLHETLSTLRFGHRAKAVKNRAVINKQHTIEELKVLLEAAKLEIDSLRRINSGGAGGLNVSNVLSPNRLGGLGAGGPTSPSVLASANAVEDAAARQEEKRALINTIHRLEHALRESNEAADEEAIARREVDRRTAQLKEEIRLWETEFNTLHLENQSLKSAEADLNGQLEAERSALSVLLQLMTERRADVARLREATQQTVMQLQNELQASNTSTNVLRQEAAELRRRCKKLEDNNALLIDEVKKRGEEGKRLNKDNNEAAPSTQTSTTQGDKAFDRSYCTKLEQKIAGLQDLLANERTKKEKAVHTAKEEAREKYRALEIEKEKLHAAVAAAAAKESPSQNKKLAPTYRDAACSPQLPAPDEPRLASSTNGVDGDHLADAFDSSNRAAARDAGKKQVATRDVGIGVNTSDENSEARSNSTGEPSFSDYDKLLLEFNKSTVAKATNAARDATRRLADSDERCYSLQKELNRLMHENEKLNVTVRVLTAKLEVRSAEVLNYKDGLLIEHSAYADLLARNKAREAELRLQVLTARSDAAVWRVKAMATSTCIATKEASKRKSSSSARQRVVSSTHGSLGDCAYLEDAREHGADELRGEDGGNDVAPTKKHSNAKMETFRLNLSPRRLHIIGGNDNDHNLRVNDVGPVSTSPLLQDAYRRGLREEELEEEEEMPSSGNLLHNVRVGSGKFMAIRESLSNSSGSSPHARLIEFIPTDNSHTIHESDAGFRPSHQHTTAVLGVHGGASVVGVGMSVEDPTRLSASRVINKNAVIIGGGNGGSATARGTLHSNTCNPTAALIQDDTNHGTVGYLGGGRRRVNGQSSLSRSPPNAHRLPRGDDSHIAGAALIHAHHSYTLPPNAVVAAVIQKQSGALEKIPLGNDSEHTDLASGNVRKKTSDAALTLNNNDNDDRNHRDNRTNNSMSRLGNERLDDFFNALARQPETATAANVHVPVIDASAPTVTHVDASYDVNVAAEATSRLMSTLRELGNDIEVRAERAAKGSKKGSGRIIQARTDEGSVLSEAASRSHLQPSVKNSGNENRREQSKEKANDNDRKGGHTRMYRPRGEVDVNLAAYMQGGGTSEDAQPSRHDEKDMNDDDVKRDVESSYVLRGGGGGQEMLFASPIIALGSSAVMRLGDGGFAADSSSSRGARGGRIKGRQKSSSLGNSNNNGGHQRDHQRQQSSLSASGTRRLSPIGGAFCDNDDEPEPKGLGGEGVDVSGHSTRRVYDGNVGGYQFEDRLNEENDKLDANTAKAQRNSTSVVGGPPAEVESGARRGSKHSSGGDGAPPYMSERTATHSTLEGRRRSLVAEDDDYDEGERYSENGHHTNRMPPEKRQERGGQAVSSAPRFREVDAFFANSEEECDVGGDKEGERQQEEVDSEAL